MHHGAGADAERNGAEVEQAEFVGDVGIHPDRGLLRRVAGLRGRSLTISERCRVVGAAPGLCRQVVRDCH